MESNSDNEPPRKLKKTSNVIKKENISNPEKEGEMSDFDEKIKGSRIWNYFTKLPNDRFSCKVCRKSVFMFRGSTSELRKHFATHSILEIKENKIVGKRALKRAWVWNYYEEVTGDTSWCKICRKLISKSRGSTTSMKHHLKTHSITENVENEASERLELAEREIEDKRVAKVPSIEISNFRSFVATDENSDEPGIEEKSKSGILSFFKKLTDDEYLCRICFKTLDIFKGSTSEMKKHISSHTTSELQEENSKENGGKLRRGYKKSWIWQYYESISTDTSWCKICQKLISKSNGSTTTMKYHLRTHNIAENDENEKSEKHALDETEDSIGGQPIVITNVCSIFTLEDDGDENMTNKKGMSRIWGYFKRISDEECLCKICGEAIDTLRGSTSEMNVHLSTHSINELKEEVASGQKSLESFSGKKLSWVWKYFEEITSETSWCTICNKLISKNNRSLTSMKYHLKKHKIFEPQFFDSSGERNILNNYEDIHESRPEEISNKTNLKCKKQQSPSWVWNHYEKLTNESSMCNICRKTIKRSGGSSTSMKKHLKLHNIFEPIDNLADKNTTFDDVDMKPKDQCYVCNISLGIERFGLITLSGFTETPIHKMLEFFTGVKTTPQERRNSSVCRECFVSLDSYDELQMQAGEIKNKLTKLFNEKNEPADQSEIIFIKQEPGLCPEDEKQVFVETEPDIEDKHSLEEIFMLNNLEEDNERDTPSIDNRKKQAKKIDFETKQVQSTSSKGKGFLDHKEIHIPKKSKFRCDQCAKTFNQKSSLEVHLAADHKPSDGPYECPTCFKIYKTRKSLRFHSYIHSNKRSLLCVVCGATFHQKYSLTTHMLMHDDVRPFPCEVPGCNKSFRNAVKLKIHLRVHTGEKIFECSFCPGKRFAQKYGLDLHVKSHHKNEAPQSVICKICNIKIPTKSKLKLHLTNVHQVA